MHITTLFKNEDSILYVLTKQLLCMMDIFFFNEQKATSHESCNYPILELIKDGIFKEEEWFKIPNVANVFWNHMPKTRELHNYLAKVNKVVNMVTCIAIYPN